MNEAALVGFRARYISSPTIDRFVVMRRRWAGGVDLTFATVRTASS
jgi:hypothetical protein